MADGMTPTDELRARLDELGVEWWDIETNDKSQTLTECIIDDVRCKYRKVGRGFIVSTCTEGSVTPEQAIAATVGAGTCKLLIEKRPHHGPWIYHFGCGYDFWLPTDCPMPVLKHCPNCGKRIAKED